MAATVFALTLSSGCDDGSGRVLEPASRKAVVESTVRNVVRPRMEALVRRTETLHTAIAQLCTQPNQEAVEHARSAWHAAFLAWRSAGPVLFGPARVLQLRRRLDYWPTLDVVLVKALEPATPSDIREDPTVRGFAAAEMLLFGDENFPADDARSYSAARCAHLESIVGEVADLAAQVAGRWRDGFAETLISGPPNDALALITAQMLNVLDAMLWHRLGLPADFFRGPASPEKLEAWRSGASLAGIYASLETVQLLNGGDGRVVGIANALAPEHAKAAAALVSAGEASLNVATEFQSTLRQVLVEDPDSVESLYQTVTELRNRLSNAVETLGLAVRFETDGD